jgi:threonine/homoserine efflux transporter RhtA
MIELHMVVGAMISTGALCLLVLTRPRKPQATSPHGRLLVRLLVTTGALRRAP